MLNKDIIVYFFAMDYFNRILKLKLHNNIRFWILLFIIVRMIGITDPPLEVAYNWRQVTTAMAARNFLEIDNNIFYPRIDIGGDKTGITGMEFPLFNYSIYLCAKVFGYNHWYGRLINLLISSLGMFYFFRLVKLLFGEKHAFISTLILLFSIWFVYARKIMPDTFSFSLALIGMFYGIRYLKKLSPYPILELAVYGVLTGAAILSKLPTGYIFVVFLIPIVSKKIPFARKLFFSLVSIFVLIPSLYWYFYWVPYLEEEFELIHYYFGRNFAQGFRELFELWPQALERFYDGSIKYIGFAMFLFGIYHGVKAKNHLLMAILTLSFLSFFVFMVKSGYNFPTHMYYPVPFVPIMALVAGYGVLNIKKVKLAKIILIAICIEGGLNQHNDFIINDKNIAIANLEQDLDKVSSRDDLIIINSIDYPTPMYFAHRKGWINSNEMIGDTDYIKSLRAKGLRHIVILKRAFGTEIKLGYPVVLENIDYCIYSI